MRNGPEGAPRTVAALMMSLMFAFIIASCNENNPADGGGAVDSCGLKTVDYAGQACSTVRIGAQCWLKENLNAGVMIDASLDASDNGTIERYCYDNDPANCNTYGGLYGWDEAMQYDTAGGAQGICPPGWHVPTLAEFKTLSSAVGGDGNALKAVGQGSGGAAGTNTSGFTALFTGNGQRIGGLSHFWALGQHSVFWSSTEDTDSSRASIMYFDDQDSIIYLFSNNPKTFLNPVRCLED